jgi:hypothetical protein
VPDWEDREGVRALVDKALLEMERLEVMEEAERAGAMPEFSRAEIGDSLSKRAEREADEIIEAARRGNWRPLAERLQMRAAEWDHLRYDAPHLFDGPRRQARQAETYGLIAARLLRKAKKQGKGRPRKAAHERNIDPQVLEAVRMPRLTEPPARRDLVTANQ